MSKPTMKRLTIRIPDAEFAEFQSAWRRRGRTQNAAAVSALKEWTSPSLPANDNVPYQEGRPEMVILYAVFAVVFLIGAAVGYGVNVMF